MQQQADFIAVFDFAEQQLLATDLMEQQVLAATSHFPGPHQQLALPKADDIITPMNIVIVSQVVRE